MTIQLGDRVKCNLTGFTGIVICMTTWLNGCIRAGVQPEALDKDGKVQDDRHFDIQQVTLVEKSVHKPVVLAAVVAPAPAETTRSTGGPARESGNFRR